MKAEISRPMLVWTSLFRDREHLLRLVRLQNSVEMTKSINNCLRWKTEMTPLLNKYDAHKTRYTNCDPHLFHVSSQSMAGHGARQYLNKTEKTNAVESITSCKDTINWYRKQRHGHCVCVLFSSLSRWMDNCGPRRIRGFAKTGGNTTDKAGTYVLRNLVSAQFEAFYFLKKM